jgi:hypothetical protein
MRELADVVTRYALDRDATQRMETASLVPFADAALALQDAGARGSSSR